VEELAIADGARVEALRSLMAARHDGLACAEPFGRGSVQC
jgi:hypothetical protein